MKSSIKFLIALFVLSLFTVVSYAQTEKRFHLGITAGTDLFKVTGRSFNEKAKPGLSAGFYGEYKLGRQWFIQPELTFNQAFTSTNDVFNQIYSTYGAVTSDVTLNYVNLPVMIAFKPVPELSILLGGQYGYLVNQTDGLLRFPPSGKSSQAFSKSDVGILFGGQLNLGKITITARYVINVNNINGINSSDEWRYHGFQFRAGYRIF